MDASMAPAPLISVLIASDRVEGSLSACLESLERQEGAPPFEAVIASAAPSDSPRTFSFPCEWVTVVPRNPAARRNAAALRARGTVFAFIDEDRKSTRLNSSHGYIS